MSERKNIDRLFQEKFKDFEVTPSDEIWGNIEAKLDQKKKRRVIPFWWKLSGVAAVFLLGFFITKSIYNPGISTDPSFSEPAQQNSVVNGSNPNKTERPNKKDINKNAAEIKAGDAIVSENNSSNTNTEDVNKKELKNNSSVSDAVANTDEKARNNTASENKTKRTIYSQKSAVADKKPSNYRSLKNKSNPDQNKSAVAESVFEEAQNQVAHKTNSNKSKAETDQNLILKQDEQAKQNALTAIDQKNKTSIENKNINLDDLKGNAISKIDTKEIEKKVNDTASKNSVANNELEELLNEKESKLKQESKRNRWQLTSNVAPIFLGSISNGSPIDSTLTNNSKSYNTNIGFGLGVSYVVNKKLSVRTGLNKVNISYNTNDIVFFTGLQAKMLANVSPTASSSMIHVETPSNRAVSATSENGFLPFESSIAHENSGYLKQEIGYIEMPVEMTYSLFDKKFGLKIIGGFSSLFLQDNSISIVSKDSNVLLGKASNLNDVHFSTNLGLGIKYGFMKSFEFNLEPTVKYQLNTFSSNSGNFKPYIFGIYSGISYRF
ncbi:outer membrane beta-barrel protein [Flavobacterium sp. AS60]|uniref:outer membrane beta-barrel protein n=1 Tax=Flavobacterium anseongense TaxID=2910677 RepID=UPI001F39B864|nr:outer membrane beta-barrel protein [Flavobacterium sp. AS60]MCF6129729.1 outer membrane beta-barrel protein [Flavobacterium sp. AS60]